MPTKPRSDSKLKTLPPALQAQVFALCQAKGYAEVKAWLRSEHSVDTSTGALSQFYAWFPLQRRLEQAATFASNLKDQIAQLPALQGKASEVSDITQIAFEMKAVETDDAELYFNLKKLRLKERDQVLVGRRVALLEKKAAQADAAEGVTRDETLTPAAREAKLKEIFGLR